MKKTAERGFTLIEVIVVAMLLSLLALGAFSLFMMYMKESKETVAYLKMQRQAEGLMDEIGRRVRESKYVMIDGDASCADFAVTDPDALPSGSPKITFFDHDCNEAGFFMVENNGMVKVGSEAFVVGDTIWSESPNIFEVYANRKQVYVKITLLDKKTDNTLSLERGVFQCRL